MSWLRKLGCFLRMHDWRLSLRLKDEVAIGPNVSPESITCIYCCRRCGKHEAVKISIGDLL